MGSSRQRAVAVKRRAEWLPLAAAPIAVVWLFWALAATAAHQQQQQQAPNQTQAAISAPTTTPKPNYLETGRQITGILDRFMSLGYDKRVRPNYAGPPVEVNVTMRILSISSVSEVMMDFTADFYFRQTWHDPRLSFKKLGDIQTLYVGAEVSKKIWLPDTFFGNEKLAYFHEATTPNVFLRIDHSGEVYRSIRLTVTSSCPMNLQYFPMDRQRCTIEAESYGYNVKDIIYRWARRDTAVERDKEISLPQFDIVKTVQKYRLEELSSGTYSRLIAEIHFARRMGYYLIQIYIPSSLIVVISWVSFWLHRNASPARVQLGVTTVLTMTTLMSSTNAALPKISYVKSIDIFLGTCFVMVFAALLEYATVGYLGKRIAMRKAHAQHSQSQAQARVFAQLQAQGAQGDPVPPTISSSLMLGGGPSEATVGLGGPNTLLGGQHQLLLHSPQLAATGLNGGQQQAEAHFHHLHTPLSAELGGSYLGGSIASASGGGVSLEAPVAPERNGHPRCHCAHCHSASAIQQQQQHHHQPPARGNGACHAHRTACCAHAGNDTPRTPRQQHKQQNPGSNGGSCCCSSHLHHPTSATLPRNLAFTGSNDQVQQLTVQADKLLHGGASSSCDLSLGRAAGVAGKQQANELAAPPGSAHLLANNTAGLPPSYCTSPSRGATKAATAAAATFVNLHRRQKGLPPSNNPNFAQFAWLGQQNRSTETIFGIRPSDIDKYSRVVFPVCFVCFQLMYWIVYLHISAFLDSEQVQQQQQQQQQQQLQQQQQSS